MTAYAQDQHRELDWVVIAQAEGILAARHDLDIAEATAWLRTEAAMLGTGIGELAEDLVRSAAGREPVVAPRPLRVVRPRSARLDLDEEITLHDEMRGRRPEPRALDVVTEAALRRLLT